MRSKIDETFPMCHSNEAVLNSR